MSQQPALVSRSASVVPGYAWVVLFAIYIATVAAPLNQMKVPPVMPVLRQAFHMGYAQAGMLMSIFSILGFALAIPAGFIMQRIGIKMTGLMAVGSVLIGTTLGAISETMQLLFIGRLIEGAGMGLIMVAGPAAISLWFPAQQRGLPMGIWATTVGIGNIAMLNLAPVFAASHGWRSVWWGGALFAALALVIFAVLFRIPRPHEIAETLKPANIDPQASEPSGILQAMANKNLWLISIEFMIINVVLMALSSFYPDFLNTERGYSLTDASLITSIMMVVALFTGPLSGYVSDRLGKRKILIVYPCFLLTLYFLFPFTATGWAIPAVMVAAGMIGGPIAPITLAAVPEIMTSSRYVGVGIGVIILGQNIGMLIGPALFGRLVEVANWSVAGYMMVPICAIAAAAASLTKIR